MITEQAERGKHGIAGAWHRFKLAAALAAVMIMTVCMGAEAFGSAPDISSDFTDPIFLEQVLLRLGKAAGDPLYQSDVSGVTGLNVAGCGITSLDGIEHFTALEELNCGYNQLTSLDISANTALKMLYCEDNQLSSLDLYANTALTWLNFNSNSLSALDVSANTVLEGLYCSDNALTALDLSANTMLTYLDCVNNSLSALDVSANTALVGLYCSENQLSALDVSINTALVYLYCFENQLSALDVSTNTTLVYLNCSYNPLTTLDVSANTALEWFMCYSSQLSTLDVSSNTALTNLYCNNNSLTALDISANTALTWLSCYQNNMLSPDDVNGWKYRFSSIGDQNSDGFWFYPQSVSPTTAPKVIRTTPADGETNVTSSGSITVVFDQPVTSAGTFSLDGVQKPVSLDGPGTYTVDYSGLPDGRHTFTVQDFESPSGAVSVPYSASFTVGVGTGTSPGPANSVSYTSPYNGQLSVPRDGSVVIRFAQPLNASGYGTLYLDGAAQSNWSLSGDRYTLSLPYYGLYDGRHEVRLTGFPGVADYTFWFETGAGGAYNWIAWVTPGNGERVYSDSGSISVRFDRVMSQGYGSVRLGGYLSGGYWSYDGRVYTVEYRGLPNGWHTWSGGGFRGADGGYCPEFSFSFTVEARAGQDSAGSGSVPSAEPPGGNEREGWSGGWNLRVTPTYSETLATGDSFIILDFGRPMSIGLGYVALDENIAAGFWSGDGSVYTVPFSNLGEGTHKWMPTGFQSAAGQPFPEFLYRFRVDFGGYDSAADTIGDSDREAAERRDVFFEVPQTGVPGVWHLAALIGLAALLLVRCVRYLVKYYAMRGERNV